MDIRMFQNQDQDQVIQLWQDCGLVVPWNDPGEDIRRKIKHSPDGFLVCSIDRKIVSTLMVGYDGHRGWVNYLAVAPDRQMMGIGREMMAYAENWLLLQGCPKLNLQIRSTNDQVIRFYESIGYTNDEVISLGKRLIAD